MTLLKVNQSRAAELRPLRQFTGGELCLQPLLLHNGCEVLLEASELPLECSAMPHRLFSFCHIYLYAATTLRDALHLRDAARTEIFAERKMPTTNLILLLLASAGPTISIMTWAQITDLLF